MQKDEEDILEDWIIYHSHLFGITNIYIIDNNSQDASKQILDKYKSKGLNVFERSDYTRKGDYLYEMIRETTDHHDISIPLDMDEFIAVVDVNKVPRDISLKFAKKCLAFDTKYYLNQYPDIQLLCKKDEMLAFDHFVTHGYRNSRQSCPAGNELKYDDEQALQYINNNQSIILKNYPDWSLSCDKETILKAFDELPVYGRYSFIYYLSSRCAELEYQSPIEQITSFDVINLEKHQSRGNYNKKFFIPKTLCGLDHGNHYGRVDGLLQADCCNTNLVLFHFHNRGILKLIQKCKNDIMGFGHIKNISDQRELKEKLKQNVPGAHNIETYLNYLQKGPYSLSVSEEEGLQISELAKTLKSLK